MRSVRSNRADRLLRSDTDSCYNVPAIGPAGRLAEGLPHDNVGPAEDCREASNLNNQNVYVRTRCNHGWCAFLYDYYFEKDVAVPQVSDVGGHRHDWEHIAVFVQGGAVKVVAASAHGDYETRRAADVRFQGSHAKIVYHKDGGSTHAFRFANAGDDAVENAKGVWIRAALVGWDGFPSLDLRSKMTSHVWGPTAEMGIIDGRYKDQLNYAKNDLVPNFDTGAVGPN